MLDSNMSITEIAKNEGVSRSTMYKFISQNRVIKKNTGTWFQDNFLFFIGTDFAITTHFLSGY